MDFENAAKILLPRERARGALPRALRALALFDTSATGYQSLAAVTTLGVMVRSILACALLLGCSRSLPESHGRDVATGVPRAMASGSPPGVTHTTLKSKAVATAPLTTSAVAAPSTPMPETAKHPFRFPEAERVVAIGDLHGDLASAREALRLAGAIDAKDHWAGGKLVLVQVGDQLDRGDDEPEILSLLERLAEEAPKAGGAVHVLNGNHELMNAVGDLRYVTEDGLRDFSTTQLPSSAHLPAGLPTEARGRFAAFTPGSDVARKLAARNIVTIVGDTVFAHAGVLPKHVRYGVDRINDEVSRFLRGERAELPTVVSSEDAPVWTRVYGEATPSAQACDELQAVLTALSVKRMVVGHTPQQGGISAACDGRVYRVDVGLSDYYGKSNPTQVLELTPKGAKVLGVTPAL